MPLTRKQLDRIAEWLAAARVVNDMSWGLVDTTVLRVRSPGGDFVVKAAGPGNHHLRREVIAHHDFTGPWLLEGRVGRLLHADLTINLIVLEYLPGTLVDDGDAATDPEVHRQAGQLLAALHRQAGRLDDRYEQDMDARALRWLDGEHRIGQRIQDEARAVIAAQVSSPAELVPTHGDWQPRNWLLEDGRVLVIDLGRADSRPALTDLVRLSQQQWLNHPDLETAFLQGYGKDPREVEPWRRELLRQAIGTACWAYEVGDEQFEEHGHHMLERVLASY